MLTGYGNIATAVAAIKAGAVDYLPKPANADDITASLLETEKAVAGPAKRPDVGGPGPLEHIQRVFEQCGRNVSETARRLKMHRRTCSVFSISTPREAKGLFRLLFFGSSCSAASSMAWNWRPGRVSCRRRA